MFGSIKPERLLGENDASFHARCNAWVESETARLKYTADTPFFASPAHMETYAGLDKQPTSADPDPLRLLPPQQQPGEPPGDYAKRWRDHMGLDGDDRARAAKSYAEMQAKRAAAEAEKVTRQLPVGLDNGHAARTVAGITSAEFVWRMLAFNTTGREMTQFAAPPKPIARSAAVQRPKRTVEIVERPKRDVLDHVVNAIVATSKPRSPRAPSANRPPPLWMIVAALVQQRIVITVRKHWWKAILAAGAATEVATHVPHFR